jgi:anti-sigma regulatory factor (Ser/Thr protein kinase)
MSCETASCGDHVALLYRSAADLAERLAPSVTEGLAGGEAVLVCLGPDKWHELARHLGPDAERVTYMPPGERYERPVEAMAALWSFVSRQVATGASGVRAIGELTFDGSRDADWVRYEAAVNEVFAGLPLAAICVYDEVALGSDIIEAACCTHPHLETGEGRRASEAYGDPADVCAGLATASLRPDRRPDVQLSAVIEPRLARQAAAELIGAGTMADALQGLDVVLSELVTNALRHGGTPARVSLWREPGAIVAVVADDGPGIDDPFAGLRPPALPERGAGLWIANRFSSSLTIEQGPSGGAVVTARVDVGTA